MKQVLNERLFQYKYNMQNFTFNANTSNVIPNIARYWYSFLIFYDRMVVKV